VVRKDWRWREMPVPGKGVTPPMINDQPACPAQAAKSRAGVGQAGRFGEATTVLVQVSLQY